MSDRNVISDWFWSSLESEQVGGHIVLLLEFDYCSGQGSRESSIVVTFVTQDPHDTHEKKKKKKKSGQEKCPQTINCLLYPIIQKTKAHPLLQSLQSVGLS